MIFSIFQINFLIRIKNIFHILPEILDFVSLHWNVIVSPILIEFHEIHNSFKLKTLKYYWTNESLKKKKEKMILHSIRLIISIKS